MELCYHPANSDVLSLVPTSSIALLFSVSLPTINFVKKIIFILSIILSIIFWLLFLSIFLLLSEYYFLILIILSIISFILSRCRIKTVIS